MLEIYLKFANKRLEPTYMDLKDCRPGLQVIITAHAHSSIAIPENHRNGLLFSSVPWYTFELYKQQGIILNDRSETFEELRKTINPITGKLYNIKVAKHKVAIMLTTGDKVYLRPSEFKVLRSK